MLTTSRACNNLNSEANKYFQENGKSIKAQRNSYVFRGISIEKRPVDPWSVISPDLSPLDDLLQVLWRQASCRNARNQQEVR